MVRFFFKRFLLFLLLTKVVHFKFLLNLEFVDYFKFNKNRILCRFLLNLEFVDYF